MKTLLSKHVIALVCALSLAVLFGGQESVWGGSILEGGVTDVNAFIDVDDAANLVGGDTINLGADGSITANSAFTAYTVRPAYTLNIGDHTVTVASSSGSNVVLENGGNLTVGANGSIVLADREGTFSTDSGATTTNNGTIHVMDNGRLDIGDGSSLINNTADSKIILSKGVIYNSTSTSGGIVNNGTITFDGDMFNVLYNYANRAGAFDNAGGTVQLVFAHHSLSDLLADMNSADAGTVEFTSGNAGGIGFDVSGYGFGDGLFKFDERQSTYGSGVINVGAAVDVEFAGTGNVIGADVTAKTIIITGTTTFTNASSANGDLDIQANTAFNTAFSGHDISVSNNATLTLGTNADVTISSGNTMDVVGGSSISNAGEITFAAGSAYSGGGSIDNAAGTLNIAAYVPADHAGILADLAGSNAGTVRFTSGDLGATGISKSGLTAGLFKFDAAQNTTAAYDVSGADVEFAGTGNSIGADVTAKTIIITGATDFATGVLANGDLDVQADTGYDATFSGHDVSVSNNSTLTLGTSADVAISSGNTMDVAGGSSISNAGEVTFAAGSAYSGGGSIDNAAGTLNIAYAAADHAGILADLAGSNAGTVRFTSGNLGATGISKSGLTAGLFKFDAAQNTTAAIDVGGADVEFAGAGSNIGANVTAKTIIITGATDFAAGALANGDLDVQANAGYNAAFSGHDIFVSNNATLTLNANAGVTVSGGKALDIQTGSTVVNSGTITIAGGASLTGAGTLAFVNGSAIVLDTPAEVAAATVAFDFSALATEGVTLTLNGDKNDWLNQVLFNNVSTADVFATGRYQTAVNAGQLEITGYFSSAADVLAPLLSNDMSINIANGFTLLDVIDADASVGQNLKDALNNDTAVIEGWLSSPGNYRRGLRAQRQRQGEYGNAAREALSTTTAQFTSRLLRRIETNVDRYFGLASFASDAAQSDAAFASLSGRQVRSRNGGYDYCPSTTTMWADFHGGWAKQKAKSNINGYDYDGYGVSVGAERRLGSLLLGVAGGYTRAGVDVDDLSTDYDADVMNLGVYAGYIHESGFYAKASLGFAYAWNDYDVSMALGPNKKGDFDSQAYTANLDLGYVIRTCAVNVIPSVGLHYTHVRQDGWRESGGQLGTTGFFEKERYNSVDVPVALRVNKVFEAGCVKIAPEARVAWIYAAKKNRSEINYGLQGSGHTATMHGVNSGRNRFQVGAGVKAEWGGKYEASLDYDYEFRSKYSNHNLSVNVGVSF